MAPLMIVKISITISKYRNMQEFLDKIGKFFRKLCAEKSAFYEKKEYKMKIIVNNLPAKIVLPAGERKIKFTNL